MSRWFALSLLLLGVSCAGGGAEIVIDAGDAQLTKVVLFVGVGDAITDPIQPAMRGAPFPASTAWARDRFNELDERDVVAGQPVVFQFQGSSDDATEKLGVVIAVGFAGDQPVAAATKAGIDVPTDMIARYELALEPLASVDPASPLALDLWQSQPGSPEAGKTCVALFDKREMRAAAVVTEGDPDCDGWPTEDPKECQPSYYMSFTRPSLQDASCLLTERVVTNDGTISDGCVIGGPPCRDGFGPESACTAPTPFCLPKSVCNRCEAQMNDYECARNVTPLATQAPTHLHCKIYFDPQGQMCTNTFKALSAPSADVAGRHCVASDTNGWITTTGQPWDKRVDFKEGSAELRVEIANVQPNCNFDITVTGAAEARTSFAGLVAGKLDNGRGIAMPIVFELDPQLNVGCTNQIACQATWSWDLTELVDQCINTPVQP